jgi:hypothetical protein
VIILGDTNVEALILNAIPENIPQGKFGEMIDSDFPDEQIRDEIRTAFGLSTEGQSFEKYRDAVRLLLGSTMFQGPNIGIAKAALALLDGMLISITLRSRNRFLVLWRVRRIMVCVLCLSI